MEKTSDVQLSLTVQGANSDQINSYINREIRSLKDVEVIDNRADADYNMSIIAMEAKAGSRVTGYALSILITSPAIPFAQIRKFVKDEMVIANIVDALKQEHRTVESHEIRLGPTDNLRSECESLVAEWDTKYFNVVRRVVKHLKNKQK